MKTTCNPRVPRTTVARAAALALALAAATPAHAVLKDWICGSQFYETASCWSPVGVPEPGDALRMLPRVSGPDRLANSLLLRDGFVTVASLYMDGTDLTLNNSGRGMTVNQIGGSFTASLVTVGDLGLATYAQSAGSHTATTLRLGLQGGGDGRYELTGGVATLQTASTEVGVAGSALFTQSGSMHSSGSLTVGAAAGGNGRYELKGGLLQTVSVAIGPAGNGVFEHSGGTHSLDDAMTVGATGRYSLSGSGVLQMGANTSVINLGSFEQTGGSFTGTLDNQGSFFIANAPVFNGRLINRGSVVMDSSATFSNGMRNEASFDPLPTGRSLTLGGAGLDNAGHLQLAGGTLQGSGALANHASLAGHGRIAGSGGFRNHGSLVQDTGVLALANSGGQFNHGQWSIPLGAELQLSTASGTLSNHGSITLAGGRISGAGSLDNGADGTLGGRGTIGTALFNTGTLALGSGDQLRVTGSSFFSSGLVELGAGTALLSGTALVNSGLVWGRGRVANDLDNGAAGRVQAEGGVLVLAGKVSNHGQMQVSAGATLLLQGTLAAQTGSLQLSGGTIDTAGGALRNDGVISGFGGLRSTVIENAGQMQFSDGSVQVQGSVDNLAGAAIIVSGGGAGTFYGNVQAQAGSEIRVSDGSVVVFFGSVSQASGAAFNGKGSYHFEGGLSVGNSPGLGGAQGDVVFGTGNLYRAEIGGLEPGTGYDRFVVGGALGFGGALQLSFLNGFDPAAGHRFDLFDWAHSSGEFASIDFSAAALSDGLRWDTSRLYSDGSVGVTAVPEPGAWALMAGGLLALRLHRLHRRRAAVACPCRPLACGSTSSTLST